MDYPKLVTELRTDPLGRGYATMTPAEVAVSLNARNRAGPERTLVSAQEVFDATTAQGWTTLSANEKQRYNTLLAAGTVNLRGQNTRDAFEAMFPSNSPTAANIAALRVGPLISRAEELGLGDAVGDGHVVSAREMIGG